MNDCVSPPHLGGCLVDPWDLDAGVPNLEQDTILQDRQPTRSRAQTRSSRHEMSVLLVKGYPVSVRPRIQCRRSRMLCNTANLDGETPNQAKQAWQFEKIAPVARFFLARNLTMTGRISVMR